MSATRVGGIAQSNGASRGRVLLSSLSAKTAMAVSGFGLVLFVVAHMLGNLQIYLGQETLNAYAYKLKSMPALLWSARIGLMVVFCTHLALAFHLRARNGRARPEPYSFRDPVDATLASRTMMLSGLVIFGFVIYHLLHFTLGVTDPRLLQLTDNSGHHDVYSMVVMSFQNIWVSSAYIMAMVFLALHLSHAVSSMLQTVGWATTKSRPWLDRIAIAVAATLFIGNASIPIAVLLGFITLPEGVAP